MELVDSLETEVKSLKARISNQHMRMMRINQSDSGKVTSQSNQNNDRILAMGEVVEATRQSARKQVGAWKEGVKVRGTTIHELIRQLGMGYINQVPEDHRKNSNAMMCKTVWLSILIIFLIPR